MSTIIHQYPGFPDRVACSDCGCEIWIAHATGLKSGLGPCLDNGQGWWRNMEIDEPGVVWVKDCPCRCHGAYNHVMRPKY